MSPSKILRRLRLPSPRAFLQRFRRAREGVMATEFALIAPIMIVMYFGVTEISDAFTASSKVTSVASSAADLTARESAICDAEMNDIFAALNAIMFPYPQNNMQITISSLIDTGNGTVKVAWSDAIPTTARRVVGAIVPIPAGLVIDKSGGSVIFTEVTYNYSSPAGYLIYGTWPLKDAFYLRPRRTAQISRSANGC
jgi:Flp pilus assembly protein TadG